jgi:biopolymer transport protein ExbB/TolQ
MKFFSWVKKFRLWILSGLSSVMLLVALFVLRSRNKQKEKLEAEKKNAAISKQLLVTAKESGEVKGRDSVLAEQEAAVKATTDKTTEAIHEAEKPKSRSAAEVADLLNSAYGRKSDG